MLCKSCGKKVDINKKFCTNCGWKIEVPVAKEEVKKVIPKEPVKKEIKTKFTNINFLNKSLDFLKINKIEIKNMKKLK